MWGDVVLKTERENYNFLLHEVTGKIHLTGLDNSSQAFWNKVLKYLWQQLEYSLS